jgi:hypothetical protein
MTRPNPGPGGTLYRAQPAPEPEEPSPPPATALDATPEVWSARATTTRGMIGRPATRIAAATAAIAAGQAVGLATSAVPEVVTRAVELVPDPPRTGTVYGRRPTERGPSRVFSGRLPRLRIGWHTVSPAALAQIGVSTPGTGLVIGVDRAQRPVPVRFFRPEPTRITLIGGAWAAHLIVFRALALGAYAFVTTDEPTAWRGVGERATGQADRVVVNMGDHRLPPAGSAAQPVLVIGEGGAPAATDLGAWQTQLTLVRDLDERGMAAAQDSSLVIAQRLGPGEAAFAAHALRLSSQNAQALQQIEDDMVAVLGPDGPEFVRIIPTDIERGYAGSARR